MASFLSKLFKKKHKPDDKYLAFLQQFSKLSEEINLQLENSLKTSNPAISPNEIINTMSVIAGYSCQVALKTVLQLNQIDASQAFQVISSPYKNTLIFCSDLNKPIIDDTYSIWHILKNCAPSQTTHTIDIQSIVKQNDLDIQSGTINLEPLLKTIGHDWAPIFIFTKEISSNPISWPIIFGVCLTQLLKKYSTTVNYDDQVNSILATILTTSKLSIPMKAIEDSVVFYPAGAPKFHSEIPTNMQPDDYVLQAFNDQRAENPWVASRVIYPQFYNSIAAALQNDKGVQIESLMATIGSLAGYASQVAVREIYANNGYMKSLIPFMLIETPDKEKFYMGDNLNYFLVEGTHAFWNFIAHTAQENGAKLPDINDYFKYSVQEIGNESYGTLRVPEKHQISGKAFDHVLPIWNAIYPELTKFCPNPEEWPIMFGLIGQKAMNDGKSLVPADIALNIMMESAVLSSKYDFS